jgi:hypothetical protein
MGDETVKELAYRGDPGKTVDYEEVTPYRRPAKSPHSETIIRIGVAARFGWTYRFAANNVKRMRNGFAGLDQKRFLRKRPAFQFETFKLSCSC